MRHLASLLGIVCALGCSSSDSGSPGGVAGQSGVDEYCARRCAREHTCIASDETTCKAKCKNDLAAAGPKLRSDYLAGINTCLDGVDCSKWATESAKCPGVSKSALAATQATQDFCNAYVKKQKDCGATLVDLATCQDNGKVYGDATLAEANACLSKSCTEYGACVIATIGGK